jgi:hypothetical protein
VTALSSLDGPTIDDYMEGPREPYINELWGTIGLGGDHIQGIAVWPQFDLALLTFSTDFDNTGHGLFFTSWNDNRYGVASFGIDRNQVGSSGYFAETGVDYDHPGGVQALGEYAPATESTINVFTESTSTEDRWAAGGAGIIKLDTGHFLAVVITTKHTYYVHHVLAYVSTTKDLDTTEWDFVARTRIDDCASCDVRYDNSIHLISDESANIYMILGYNNNQTAKGLGENKLRVFEATITESAITLSQETGLLELEQPASSKVDFGASMGVYVENGRLRIVSTSAYEDGDNSYGNVLSPIGGGNPEFQLWWAD